MVVSTEAEAAVRTYLKWLGDPSSLIDARAVKEAQDRFEAATDVMDKLKALAARKNAETVDEAGLRAAFVQHAKPWAEAEGIPFDAFEELGVRIPSEVLESAGLKPKTRDKSSKPRQRAKAVPADEIKEWILTKAESPFMFTHVQRGAGGSMATVRKVLGELIDGGQVESLGPDPTYTGRGRAPLLYRVIPAP